MSVNKWYIDKTENNYQQFTIHKLRKIVSLKNLEKRE